MHLIKQVSFLFFCYLDSTIYLVYKPKILSFHLASFCSSAGWLLFDLAGTLKDRFSGDMAHLYKFDFEKKNSNHYANTPM